MKIEKALINGHLGIIQTLRNAAFGENLALSHLVTVRNVSNMPPPSVT